jgi:hypothetical protein
MSSRIIAGVAATLGMVLVVAPSFSQTAGVSGPQSGPGATAKSPSWFLYTAPPADVAGGGGRGGAGGRGGRAGGGRFAACADDTAKYCSGKTGAAQQSCLQQNLSSVSGECKVALSAPEGGYDTSHTPPCAHSPICTLGAGQNPGGITFPMTRVEWKSTPLNMGYTPVYPDSLPPGGGGASAVAVDSKGNLWAFQRNAPGKSSLFKFDANHNLVLSLGDEVLGHQDKPHGITIDAQDNIWICDANGATIEEVSPDGKLLKTIGVHGHRGDWDEPKGQRYLWQPLAIVFAKNGDMYIGEGHANESPNDLGLDDPTNHAGAARILHLDKDGKFINQWYGDQTGQGKFFQVHGLALDPKTGNVWIGDREQYRLVEYTGDGRFIKTLQMRNLVCNVAFDPQGNLWIGSGQDAQLLKIDPRNGNVLGAIGNGPGRGDGQIIETAYPVWDSHGNIYEGDTSNGRVTEWVGPRNK